MRASRLWIVLGLCACSAGKARFASYQPGIATGDWCRLGPGAYAFMPAPGVAPQLVRPPLVGPQLVGDGCRPEARPQAAAASSSVPSQPKAPDSSTPSQPAAADPSATRRTMPSTLAELVVAPGASIEIPVQLPPRLRGTGCQIESVVVAHGRDAADLAIDIADPSGGKPIVSYKQLPPPADRDNVKRIVRDHDGAARGGWSPDRKPPEISMRVADRDLWPTSAVLKFNGSTDGDGFATVGFEIPKDREAPPEPRRVEPETPPAGPGAPPPGPSALPPGPPPGPPSPSGSPYRPGPPPDPSGSPYRPGPPPGPPGSPYRPEPPPGPSSDPAGPLDPYSPGPPPAEGSPAVEPPAEELPPYPQPKPLELITYRHSIGIAAADSFSIVLRARERPFGVAVRSDRESSDPRLAYRAPGAAEPMQTHLVAQVAVVISRCGRPLPEILTNID